MIKGLIRTICFCAIGSIMYSLGASICTWKYWAVMLLTIAINLTV